MWYKIVPAILVLATAIEFGVLATTELHGTRALAFGVSLVLFLVLFVRALLLRNREIVGVIIVARSSVTATVGYTAGFQLLAGLALGMWNMIVPRLPVIPLPLPWLLTSLVLVVATEVSMIIFDDLRPLTGFFAKERTADEILAPLHLVTLTSFLAAFVSLITTPDQIFWTVNLTGAAIGTGVVEIIKRTDISLVAKTGQGLRWIMWPLWQRFANAICVWGVWLFLLWGGQTLATQRTQEGILQVLLLTAGAMIVSFVLGVKSFPPKLPQPH